MGEGQVQRIVPFLLRREDRDPLVPRIRNDADRVLQVEDAGLLGDVACREILSLETFQVTPLVLADDLPRAVLLETIDHHPIITQQGVDQAA